MESPFENLLNRLQKNQSPTIEQMQKLTLKIDFLIDHDYFEFIKKHNGAAGFVNKNSYLMLWEIDDLVSLNPYYQDDEFCNAVFLIGSNGSSTSYGIKKTDGSFFKAPFIDMPDELESCGNNFTKFLLTIANPESGQFSQ